MGLESSAANHRPRRNFQTIIRNRFITSRLQIAFTRRQIDIANIRPRARHTTKRLRNARRLYTFASRHTRQNSKSIRHLYIATRRRRHNTRPHPPLRPQRSRRPNDPRPRQFLAFHLRRCPQTPTRSLPKTRLARTAPRTVPLAPQPNDATALFSLFFLKFGRGEASPRAAFGMRQYAAPPSAGAQTPRPQRPRLVPPRTTSATSHNAPVGRIANWAINRRARNAPGNALSNDMREAKRTKRIHRKKLSEFCDSPA